MAIIEARSLTREFRVGSNRIIALNDVSVAIEPGSFTILQGPSGSGKTTLINLLGALDVPSGGEIRFDDKVISALTEAQRDELRRTKMGFVFQSVALISNMSAYENVEFGLRIAGYAPAERAERAQETLTLVGLARRMHHRPHELSGGEQQRVAIARAISHRPRVLYADEPTAELDTHMGLQVVGVFRTLIVEEGVTVVMSSHDPNLVELGDRVVSLEDGRLVDAR